MRCQNYRSLEDVSFPLTPLTAIVGPNGAGKTSILRALDLVLGTLWPRMRSLRIPHDFTGFDTDKELLIEVGFDPPLQHEDAMGKQQPVAALRFRCRPYKRSGTWGEAGDLHYDFEPLDTGGVLRTDSGRLVGARSGPAQSCSCGGAASAPTALLSSKSSVPILGCCSCPLRLWSAPSRSWAMRFAPT
jgi:hypothetical protein